MVISAIEGALKRFSRDKKEEGGELRAEKKLG